MKPSMVFLCYPDEKREAILRKTARLVVKVRLLTTSNLLTSFFHSVNLVLGRVSYICISPLAIAHSLEHSSSLLVDLDGTLT